MRTTVRIKEDLLRQAKNRAAAKGRTLTSLIEDGLALILTRPKTDRRKRVVLPVSKASGGVFPGVDLNRSGDLEEVMNNPRLCPISRPSMAPTLLRHRDF